MNEKIGLALITLGVLFDLLGCVGLVRLPDVYNRIQASTKCVVLGTTLCLLGAMVWLSTAAVTIKGLLCILFLLITSATAAHALARAAYRSGVPLAKGSVVDRYGDDLHANNNHEETAL
ncbi:MAG: Na+/H+ antiporter subunit G [Gammaproteobacteria bacterium]|nr:Na+/H+ antiporter subunit G [Gammaproteobacteria bacterium]